MAMWISDSALTLSPLQISTWCTLPTKKSMHCSPTSMTARSDAGPDRETKVGWRGQVGGPAGTASGGSAKRAGAASPAPHPTLPTAPFPTHNTWSTPGVPCGQIPGNVQGLLGGVGVQVRGVGLVVAVPAVGGPQVKKSPLQPILGGRGGGQPMAADGGHHQQHVPPLQLNGVPARLPCLPQGRPYAPPSGIHVTSIGSYSSGTPRCPLSLLSGGSTSGWVATPEWGSWAPLPTLATMTLPGVSGWSSPTPGTLSVRWRWNFLKSGPPTPDPRCFCFANAGGARDPWPDFHSERR